MARNDLNTDKEHRLCDRRIQASFEVTIQAPAVGRGWTAGVTHPYSEIAGEVTTQGARLGN